jgi:hypothetical protein
MPRFNSEDPADIERKLVLCVQLLSCVYICFVPVQQYVHLLSTALCTLFTQHVKTCVHLLSTAVCIFAHVYTTVVQYRCTKFSSPKIHKSIAGTSPRYRVMVSMEPGTRQIKFFDTELQMFESLNFVQKSLILKSQNQIIMRL